MGVLGQSKDQGAAAVLPNAQGPVDKTGFFQNVEAGFQGAVAGTHSTRVGDAIYQKKAYDEIIQALTAEGEQGEDRLDMINNAPVKRPFRNPYVSSPWENLTNSAHNPLSDLYLGGDRAEMEQIWAGVQRVRQRKPDFLKQFANPGSIDALATAERQKQIAESQAVTSRASTVGSVGGFMGGMAGSVASLDPENAVGGFGTAAGKTVARTVIKRAVEGAAVNAGAAGISIPGHIADAEHLGQTMTAGDAVHQVLESAAIGGVIGGGHAAAPHIVSGVGTAVGKAADVALSHAPAPVRDAVAAASIRAGTVKDRGLLTEYRRLHNPYAVVGDISTPQERSADHVLQRDVEVREASPFTPAADPAHQGRLDAIANDLGIDLSARAVPSPAPVQTPTVRDQSGGVSSRRPVSTAEATVAAEGKDARNQKSTADGYGQFTEGTWIDTLKRHAPQLAEGKTRAEILALRHDKTIATQMTDAYGNDNGVILRQHGLEDSPGNKSLAHFLGPTDAVRVLKADPATPIERVIDPKSFAANRSLLEGKSASQVVAWAHKRIGASVDGPVARADAVPDEEFDASSPVPYTVETLKPDELAPSAATPSDEPWNPIASQHLLVWEANDGTRTVIDGGKRLAHAQSLYPEDQSIQLPAVVLREADGVSQEMAQLVGKLKNVNLGTTSLEEAAGTLADIPEIAAALKRPQFRNEIAAIAQLPYEDFGKVLNSADPIEEARATGSYQGSLRKAASWVIRNKDTGEVIMETFDPKHVAALNTKKYEAIPIQEYLGSLNERASNETGTATLPRRSAASGGTGEPPGGEGRSIASQAPDAELPSGDLYSRAVAARDKAEAFSDPVGEAAKAQTALVEHDLLMDAVHTDEPPLFDTPEANYRLSEEGDAQPIHELMKDAESDEEAAKAAADCLQPPKVMQ